MFKLSHFGIEVLATRSGGVSRSDCRHVMKIATPYELRALIWEYFFRSFGDSYRRRPPPLEEILITLFIGYVKLGLEVRGFQSSPSFLIFLKVKKYSPRLAFA